MDPHSRSARLPSLDSDSERPPYTRIPPVSVALGHRSSRRKPHGQNSHPKPPLTPNTALPSSMPQPGPNPLLPSAPASPPTPAPSPTPHERPALWHEAPEDLENPILRDSLLIFSTSDAAAKEAWLTSVVDLCDNQTLGFLHRLVGPKLKKDPFTVLPDELCLRVLEYVDDPKTFVRASSVSRRWRELVSDDQAWKILYDKHEYRRMSTDSIGSAFANNTPIAVNQPQWSSLPRSASPPRVLENMSSIDENSVNTSAVSAVLPARKAKRPRPRSTHRSRFKHRYMVESAWRKGGRMKAKHITPDQGVVTSLHLTRKYIVVALDNAKIHVFDTHGEHLRTLQGHVMGVWAMIPWEDILVSGHTSLVGQLQMRDSTLVTGGSDGSVRVWSLNTYNPIHRLAAHDNSVTSLQFDDLRIVSGGSDGRVKIWDLGTGNLIRELSQPAEAVWRVAFESERCVVMASRAGRTIMEVWDFTPPADDEEWHGGLRERVLANAGSILAPDDVLTAETQLAGDQAMLDLDDDVLEGMDDKGNDEMMDAYIEDEEDDCVANDV
ncbi:MAG: hypothetical protein Q9196_002480 [Gyalolechia fulgens]